MNTFHLLARCCLSSIVALGIVSQCALGQQQFSGKTVVSVTYQPVQQPIDPRDLSRMQLIAPGQPLDLAQVATTIDHLFSSGLYTDIQVDAEPSGTGVSIRFITKAQLFIGHVDAVGQISDPPSRGVILSDAQLYLGTPYNPDDVTIARDNIRQIMRDNGLYAGDAGSATITDPKFNQVTIRFLVNAGKRAHYEQPIIKGEPKLSDSAIVRATGWRIPLVHRWRYVTGQLTDKGTESVEKKYAKQHRLTASVDVTDMDYDPKTRRVKPTLEIHAGPKVEIKAREAKLSSKKIQGLVPVYEEGSVDNDLLAEGAHNISNYFQSRGYPDVQVTPRQEPVKNDQEMIYYDISLGDRQKLVHIDIIGGNYFTPETIHERMFLQTKSLVLRYGRYSETFRHSDEKAIEALYEANGFRDAKVVSTVETNYKGKQNQLGVTFRIEPGAQWKVGSLHVTGPQRLDLGPIRDQLYSIEGQPYADVNVSSDRNRILEYYFEHGFLHASFNYKIAPGPDATSVDLTYNITEGPQDFIRSVIFSGLNRTKPKLVDHIVDLKDGDPISMAKINDISRRLTDLGIFAGVNSATQDPDGDNRYKYVLYDFDEAARYSFNVGLGMEFGVFGQTTSNLSESGGAQGVSPLVSFNVNRLNFLGTGQTISLQTKYSTLEQRESLNYIVPRFFGSSNRTVTFSLLYDTTQDVQTFSARREEASVQTSQRFNRASTLLLRFDYRRVSTSNIEIPALIIPLFSQPVRIGMLSASYIQDHRDNPADAHHGFWNTLDAGIAGGYFGSQRSFARLLGRNATYTSLGHNLVLARQTQFGAIIPITVNTGYTSYDDIPLPERFFGGGGVSMRGFADNQAGPRDLGTTNEQVGGPSATAGQTPLPTGFPIGGNALFFNNVELRFPLLGPNISGVLFEDMGNIYTTLNNMSFGYHQANAENFNYAVQAAGFGIRYKTPLGPVRVDLSYALNPPHYSGFSTSETTQQLIQCTPYDIANHTSGCTTGPQQLSHINFFFSIGQAF